MSHTAVQGGWGLGPDDLESTYSGENADAPDANGGGWQWATTEQVDDVQCQYIQNGLRVSAQCCCQQCHRQSCRGCSVLHAQCAFAAALRALTSFVNICHIQLTHSLHLLITTGGSGDWRHDHAVWAWSGLVMLVALLQPMCSALKCSCARAWSVVSPFAACHDLIVGGFRA